MPKFSQNYQKAFDIIDSEYGWRKIELDYETPFQLLCAVILSAQTTDKQVNKVTPPLFEKVREPEDMKNISLEEIENFLQYINFFRNKSRFIRETGIILADNYNSQIPNDLKILTTLPWVGIKTAKVVLNVLYDESFVAVDTHIHRVANRIWLVSTNSPLETDKELDKILPTEIKKKIHHPLVLFGRYHCMARKPKCKNCKILQFCKYWKENQENLDKNKK